MSLLNLTPPSIGQPNATEDVDTVNAFNAIQTWANGNIDEQNITGATVQRLGLNNSGNVGRGATIIAATESRTNVAYGTLGTPDQVAGIVLPANGLIAVMYQATWQESVAGAARAGLFLNSNQVTRAVSSVAAPTAVETGTFDTTTPNTDCSLALGSSGLNSRRGVAYTGDVSTGQLVGMWNATDAPTANLVTAMFGAAYIFAAAGTYTISIQFKSTSGSVTAKNRKLWAWTVGF